MNDKLGGAHPIGISAWLLAIIAAFVTSLEMGAAVTIGYLIQWTLKAPARVSMWIAPAVALGSCFASYWFFHPPAGAPDVETWVKGYAMWTLSTLGAGSAAGMTRGAAGTNTL